MLNDEASSLLTGKQAKRFRLPTLIFAGLAVLAVVVVVTTSTMRGEGVQVSEADVLADPSQPLPSPNGFQFASVAQPLPHKPKAPVNNRPVVGVVTLPVLTALRQFGSTYLAASYVKIVESGGARVVPIRYDYPRKELDLLMNSLNGIVLTGGFVSLNPQEAKSSVYTDTIKYLFAKAKELNDKGQYFPIWATCLGMQQISIIVSEDPDFLDHFDSQNYIVPLNFTDDARDSRFFSGMSDQMYDYLGTQVTTMNNHQFGVPPAKFHANEKMSSFFKILSTNNDRVGNEFVSTMEGRDYPFYLFQWHPEKSPYEWNEKYDVDHSPFAMLIASYCASFFVDEARNSDQHFADPIEENRHMIAHSTILETTLVPVATDYSEIYFWGEKRPAILHPRLTPPAPIAGSNP